MFALLCVSALLSHQAHAQNEEAQLKASYLLNFSKFIDWPEPPLINGEALTLEGNTTNELTSQKFNRDTNIRFCFIGSDRYRSDISRAINGKALKNRQAQVEFLNYRDDLSNCQVLFVRDLEPDQLNFVFGQVDQLPILTVGETDLFMLSGGMIRFYAEQGRLKFEINPMKANSVDLTISSQLLSLARIFSQERVAE